MKTRLYFLIRMVHGFPQQCFNTLLIESEQNDKVLQESKSKISFYLPVNSAGLMLERI